MNKFKNIAPIIQLLIFGGITVASVSFFLVLAFLIAFPVFDINLMDAASFSDSSNPKNIPVLKFFQIMQSIGLFVVPPVIFMFTAGEKAINALKIKEIPNSILALIALTVMIFSTPVINFSLELNMLMKLPDFLQGLEQWMQNSEEMAKILTEAFLNVDTIKGLMINIFMIAIIPAIGEEMFFRGVLQPIFIKMTRNIHWGIILSGAFFSAFHLQFYGFLPRMLMGIYFGYLFYWSRNLWLPVLAHFINNFSAVLFYYYSNKGSIDISKIDKIGTESSTLWTLFASILIITPLIYLFYRKTQKLTTV